jgi:excisionase family DNA binding protein
MSRLLLDVNEAAQELSVSRRTVQGLIYDGALASVTVGRCRRIAVVDLEAYVHELRSGGSDAVHVPATKRPPAPIQRQRSKEVSDGSSIGARKRR